MFQNFIFVMLGGALYMQPRTIHSSIEKIPDFPIWKLTDN